MKKAVFTLFGLIFSIYVFAQNSEVWVEDGNNDATSTLDSYDLEGDSDFPSIYLKYSWEDDPEDPVGPVPDGQLLFKNFKIMNDKAFKISHSTGGSYSDKFVMTHNNAQFNTGLSVTGIGTFNDIGWFKDKIYIEEGGKFIFNGPTSYLNLEEDYFFGGIGRVAGNIRIEDNNYIEFGYGLEKTEHGGKIGLGFLSEGFDIIGGGTIEGERKIKLWDVVSIGEKEAPSNHADYALSVDGKIVAKEVIVQHDNWSDYVFNDSYKLMDLKELNDFILRNKHLPNIPSEQEAVNEGVEVGKMNELLLAKIEELTLYIIDLQNQINDLDSSH